MSRKKKLVGYRINFLTAVLDDSAGCNFFSSFMKIPKKLIIGGLFSRQTYWWTILNVLGDPIPVTRVSNGMVGVQI